MRADARRWTLAAALLLAMPVHAQTQADTLVADSVAPTRLDNYVRDLADPIVAAQAVALGVWDQARNEPQEWGGGVDALGQRSLSRAGGHIVGQSVRHGLAAALGRSTDYRPCGCADVEHRIAYAIVETFVDYDAQGRRRLSTPFLAGTYAGAVAPLAWHPDADLAESLQSATLSLVFSVAGNVIRETLSP